MKIIVETTRTSGWDGCWDNYKIYEKNHPEDYYYVGGLEFFKSFKIEIYKSRLKRRYKNK